MTPVQPSGVELSAAERLDRLRLARTPGVGPLTYRKLLHRFSAAADAIDALPSLSRSGGSETQAASLASAEKELARLEKMGGRLLILGEPDYPELLAMIEDAPPAISVLGDVAALGARSVGLVGARNASANGRRMAELLAADLALTGLVVVSGLARGVDAAAHEGAMQTGRTVACVAGGLDQPYPPEHGELQYRIARCGAVVAEAPLGTAPQARHFPRRNRLIAGLSLGTVVVEAARNSGSLITANLALNANRTVFAVPGSPLDPRSQGSNDLIRGGAILVTQAADVTEALTDPRATLMPLGFAEPAAPYIAPDRRLDPAAVRQAVLGLLSPEPTQVDDLVRRCQLSASTVMAVLLELELAERVETLPGNRVALLE